MSSSLGIASDTARHPNREVHVSTISDATNLARPSVARSLLIGFLCGRSMGVPALFSRWLRKSANQATMKAMVKSRLDIYLQFIYLIAYEDDVLL